MVRARAVRGVDAPGGLSFALAWSGGSHGAFDPRPDAFRLRLSICFELVSQLSHTLALVLISPADRKVSPVYCGVPRSSTILGDGVREARFPDHLLGRHCFMCGRRRAALRGG